jgi:hypothetical protein
MGLGDVIRFGKKLESRKVRAWKARSKAEESLRTACWYLTCPQPQGEMSQLAVEREEEDAWQQAEDDVFEAALLHHECEDCIDGHREGCPSLEPHEDLYDVLWDHQCSGCCPNGCEEAGLVAQATITRVGLLRLLRMR